MAQPTLIPPPAVLAPFVHYFWTNDSTEPAHQTATYQVMADGLPGLIVQQHDGLSALTDQQGSQLPTSFIYGLATTSFTNFSSGPLSVVGVSLKPQSLPLLLRVDATELTNKLITLNELADYNLNDRLMNAATQQERINLLAAFLSRIVSTIRVVDPIVERIIHHMTHHSSRLRLSSLLTDYQISERHVERKFKAAIGVGPHQYQRILTFQKAVRRMTTASPLKLSTLAYELDYADQSHFIRDFKTFSGFTPTQLLRQNLARTDFNQTLMSAIPKRLIHC